MNARNTGGGPRSATGRIAATYQMELAAGASHVASTLSPASRNASVHELAASFVVSHGKEDLNQFLLALAKRLDARADTEGAFVVRHYAAHGVAPEVLPAAKAGGTAKRKTSGGASE